MSFSNNDNNDQLTSSLNATPVPMRPPDTTTQPPMAPSPEPSPVTSQPTTNAVNALPSSSTGAPKEIPVTPGHPSFFDRALTALSGGQRYIVKDDPTHPGSVMRVPVPATKATLAQHIMAGVLSGVFAGMKAGQEHPGAAGTPNIGAAASAGFNAAEQSRKEFQNMPQQQYDQMKNRAYQTAKANLDLYSTMMASARQEEQHRTQVIQDAKPFVDAITDYDLNQKDPSKRIALAHGLTHDQALQYGQNPILSYNAVVDGYVPVMQNGQKVYMPNGEVEMEPTYTIINPHAQLLLNDEIKAQGEKYGYPQLANASTGAVIPARLLIDMHNKAIQQTVAAGALNGFAQQVYEAGGKKGTVPNFMTVPQGLLQGIPVSEQANALKALNKFTGMDVEKMMPLLAKEQPQLAANLAATIGYNQGSMEQFRKEQGRTIGQQQASPEDIAKAQRQLAVASNLDDEQRLELRNRLQAEGLSRNDLIKIQQDGQKYQLENKKEDEKKRGTYGYASGVDPTTGKPETVYVNKYDYEQDGGKTYSDFEEMKPQDVAKHRALIPQANDVQQNVNYYEKAVDTLLPKVNQRDKDNMVKLEALTDVEDVKAAIGAGGIHLSTPQIEAILSGSAKKGAVDAYMALSPSAKELYNSYLRTVASVFTYQRALAQAAPRNVESLRLDMRLVPKPYQFGIDKNGKVVDGIKPGLMQYQQNVSHMKEAYPKKLPGLSVLPSYWDDSGNVNPLFQQQTQQTQTQNNPQNKPSPAHQAPQQQFTAWSSDGKWGWNGKQWVSTGR